MESTCDISLKTWLSEEEVMQYVALSRPKIREARQSGRLPFFDLMGKIVYERAAVDKWVRTESRYHRKQSSRISPIKKKTTC